LAEYVSESLDAVDDGEGVEVPEGGCAVESHMPGSIWKIECQSGDIVEEGATLAVIEAMKIEIPIIAPERMRVDAITIEKGQTVKTGQVLFTLAPVA
ncbi:acetyl-CoA carboxylase biotin carboxyl carrier protein subunit, partial [Acinetobacter radioresistens]